MITLEIEQYCHNCNQFKPTVFANSQRNHIDKVYYDSSVGCQDRGKCESIYQRLKEESINNEM